MTSPRPATVALLHRCTATSNAAPAAPSPTAAPCAASAKPESPGIAGARDESDLPESRADRVERTGRWAVAPTARIPATLPGLEDAGRAAERLRLIQRILDAKGDLDGSVRFPRPPAR